MTKQEMALGIEVIKYTFEKLPMAARIKLVEELERETRKQRWDPLVSKVRQRATKNPISQEEINRICEETRQQLYAKRSKSRS